MEILLRDAEETDMKFIRFCVKQFVLDDADMHSHQFVVAEIAGAIVGFGRLRKHTDCTELCTLGVVVEYRGKGIGRKLVNRLIEKSRTDLFVVCIIPAFFRKFGFKQIDNFPVSMFQKHKMCTEKFVVPETYCVMKRVADHLLG